MPAALYSTGEIGRHTDGANQDGSMRSSAGGRYSAGSVAYCSTYRSYEYRDHYARYSYWNATVYNQSGSHVCNEHGAGGDNRITDNHALTRGNSPGDGRERRLR